MAQPPDPPQYGAYYPQPSGQPTNTLAIIALIAAFVVPPAGIICGIIARRQIRQTGEAGDGLALAAIIVGSAYVVLGLMFLVIGFFVLFAAGTMISHIPSPSPYPSPSVFPS